MRAVLVCPTCDDSPRWPGGTLDRGSSTPGAGPLDEPAPREEDGDPSAL